MQVFSIGWYGLQHIGIVDVVPESVLLVAFDDNAEDVQNGVPVPVEHAPGNGDALTRLRGEPPLVDLLQRDAVLCLMDGVRYKTIIVITKNVNTFFDL